MTAAEPDCESAASVETAIERIDERGRRVRDRQLQRALTALAERRDLTTTERAILARLAARLTERLLAPPKEALRTAEDDETVQVALAFLVD